MPDNVTNGLKTNEWNHTAVTVRDLDAAMRFYGRVFGFEKTLENHLTHEMETVLGVKGAGADVVQMRAPHSGHTIEFIQFKGVPAAEGSRRPVQPGAAHNSFFVEDLERTLAVVRELGGELLGQVDEFPGGKWCYAREPAGTYLEIDQLTSDR